MNTSVVKIDSTVLFELTKSSIILCFIVIVIGLGLVPTSIYFLISNNEKLFIMPIVFGIFFIVMGAGILIYLLSANKKAKTANLVVTVDFEEERFHVVSTKNNKKINEEYFSYSQVLTFRVAKTYIFITTGRNRSIPVQKSEEMISFLLSKDIRRK